MNIPAHFFSLRYPLYNLIALALMAVFCVLSLFVEYWGFDWFWQLLHLVGGLYLVGYEWKPQAAVPSPEVSSSNFEPFAPVRESFAPTSLRGALPLWVYVLLALNGVLIWGTMAWLSSEGLFFLAITVFQVMAAYYKLNAQFPELTRPSVGDLQHSPNAYLLLGAAICLVALYFPMAKSTMLGSWYTGPQYGFNIITGWGMNQPGMILSYNVPFNLMGYQVGFGNWMCLLLGIVLLTGVAQTKMNLSGFNLQRFYAIVTVLLVVWWLFFVRGWQSLGLPANLFFLMGLAMLIISLFFRQQFNRLVNRKDSAA